MKVSIATTLKEGLVVGMRSMPGNPYGGHTLAETLEQVGILTGTDKPPATVIVDKGYRVVEVEGVCSAEASCAGTADPLDMPYRFEPDQVELSDLLSEGR